MVSNFHKVFEFSKFPPVNCFLISFHCVGEPALCYYGLLKFTKACSMAQHAAFPA